MNVLQPRVSYGDLERMPEDGRRYELYDGEVFVVPSPLPLHQLAALRIYDLLRKYERIHGGLVIVSPIDIVFSQHDVLQPDVVFFTAPRQHLVDIARPIGVAPDLVVEVLSPSTAAIDRGKKMQMFARYGVPEYWLIDPVARTIEILNLSDGSYVQAQLGTESASVTSQILPALTFQLGHVLDA